MRMVYLDAIGLPVTPTIVGVLCAIVVAALVFLAFFGVIFLVDYLRRANRKEKKPDEDACPPAGGPQPPESGEDLK